MKYSVNKLNIMKQTNWIVYKITDSNNKILHIGETSDIEIRLRCHINKKGGKFYQRKDIKITSIKQFSDKRKAFEYQCKLQKKYNLLSDRDILVINAKKGAVATYNSFKLLGKLYRPVLCFDYNTNKFISEFKSIRKAESTLSVSNINKVLKGEYKQSGGYYFKYKDVI